MPATGDDVEQEAQETKPSKDERLQAKAEKNKELRGTVVDDVRALGESTMRKIQEKGDDDKSDDETEAATGAQTAQASKSTAQTCSWCCSRSGDLETGSAESEKNEENVATSAPPAPSPGPNAKA